MASLKSLGLAFAAAIAFAAISTSPASAFCARVLNNGTGRWSNTDCNNEVGTKNYIKIEMRSVLDPECGKVEAGETGVYTEDQCENTVGASKPWFKIRAPGQFNPDAGSFTGKSGFGTLKGGSDSVTCEKDTNNGEIASLSLLGPFTIQFTGCKSSGASKSGCEAKSSNVSSKGVVLSSTLHAILGFVEAGSLTGLLILPTSGKRFATLSGNECTPETSVTGSVVGLVTPVGTSQTTAKVTFATSSGKQAVKEIETGLGTVEPELVAFSEPATEATEENIEWSKAIEVT